MSGYYDPDGNVLTMDEWARMFECRRVDTEATSWWLKKTEVDAASVSTVWLGIDHQWGDGPPLFWETMIFGGDHDQDQWRYPSREAAFAAHDQIVAALRDGKEPAG